MKLNNESKTLFIPLYGKALMSKQDLFISDLKAEEIISKVNFNFKKLKQSKWLSMYMALRSRLIDDICSEYIKQNINTVVIHLGCGLDSRCLRLGINSINWYDIDFESVINLRKQFYFDSKQYKMIGKSITDFKWLDEVNVDNSKVLIIAEGLTMYLSKEELSQLLNEMSNKFINATIIFDAYSKKAVRLSKLKNPVNKMKAKIKFGMDNPNEFIILNKKLKFIKEYPIKNNEKKLKGVTKFIFENLYCGKISQTLYKLYEFRL